MKPVRWIVALALGAILCLSLVGCEESKKQSRDGNGGQDRGRREGS